MSPLTHFWPGAPARATHEAEIRAACENNAEAVMEYVDTVLWKLLYPRSVWRSGLGSSASNHVVTATLEPGGDSLDAPADTYQAGTGPTVGTSTVANKRVLGVINTLMPGPHQNRAPQFQRFYDGVLERAVPSTVPRPPPEAEPVAPPTLPLDAKHYAQYIRQHAEYAADIIHWYIIQRYRKEFWPVTTYWYGQATGVSTSAKTVTVQTETFPHGGTPSPSITVGFGARKWSASQVVGKRVRIAYDPIVGNWVDDIA